MSDPKKESTDLPLVRFLVSPKSLAVFVLLAFFALFFREVIFGGQQFCLRDGAYFYYPLFQYIHSIWNAGHLPLWDSCENLGQPLAAIPTSSVFYPGQLLFLLPFSYDTCYAWYHLIHILLAPLGMFLLCRHWKVTVPGSLLSALAYGFCGSIFGQYCNVIFLIGSAWLPFALYFGDRLLRTGRLSALAGLALVLCLIVLGGEPQSAWFVGIMLGGLWLVYWRAGFYRSGANSGIWGTPKSGGKNAASSALSSPMSKWRKILTSRIILLLGAGILGGLMAGIQVVPTLELTKDSDRSVNDIPLSLWQIPKFVADRTVANLNRYKNASLNGNPSATSPYIFYDTPHYEQKNTFDVILDGLFCRTIEFGGHPRVIYQFSLGPWHLIELVWPNSNGMAPPNLSRWCSFLPEDGTWTYSLYFGIIPLLLALSVTALRLRNKQTVVIDPRKKNSRRWRQKAKTPQPVTVRRAVRVWGTWGALLALLAALGGYGPAWFLRALYGLFGNDTTLTFINGDPVGGVYWFFCVALPMLASFRFPAKMILPAILLLTLLAGFGWDSGRKSRRLAKLTRVFFFVSLLALLIVALLGSGPFDFTGQSTDGMLGGYSAKYAWFHLVRGIIHAMVVAALFVLVLFSRSQKDALLHRRSTEKRSVEPATGSAVPDVFPRQGYRRTSVVTVLVVLLVCVDLYVANRNLLITGSPDIFHQEPHYAKLIRERKKEQELATIPPRYFRYTWYPGIMTDRSSRVSVQDRVAWDRNVLMPKYQCPYYFCNMYSTGTMMEKEYSVFAEWIHWFAAKRDMTPVFAWLDSRYLILPVVIQDEKGVDHDIKLADKWARPLSSSKDMTMEQLAREGKPVSATLWETTLTTGRAHILRNSEELDRPEWTLIDQLESGHTNDAQPGEYARITEYMPNSLKLDVNLTAPAEIVLSEQYFKGWSATLLSQNPSAASGTPLEIQRALGFCRRLTLPAGHHQVEMVYRPASFRTGLILTLSGWLLCLALMFLDGRRSRSSVDPLEGKNPH